MESLYETYELLNEAKLGQKTSRKHDVEGVGMTDIYGNPVYDDIDNPKFRDPMSGEEMDENGESYFWTE